MILSVRSSQFAFALSRGGTLVDGCLFFFLLFVAFCIICRSLGREVPRLSKGVRARRAESRGPALLRVVESFRLAVGSNTVVSRFLVEVPNLGLAATCPPFDRDWSETRITGLRLPFWLYRTLFSRF